MFAEGVIKSYNAARGFGFIAIEGNAKDLFFHIKDFPNKNIDPKVGEKLKFRIVDDQGKLKAENIVRLDVKIESANRTSENKTYHAQGINTKSHSSQRNSAKGRNAQHHYSKQPQSSSGFGSTVIGLIVIVGLIYMIYGKIQRAQLADQAPEPTYVQQIATPVESNSKSYQCDGRTHCSQMNSREEARWFVRNCPGTKMDGNNDGEPCESDSRW